MIFVTAAQIRTEHLVFIYVEKRQNYSLSFLFGLHMYFTNKFVLETYLIQLHYSVSALFTLQK